jgi:hypothetical protein
MLTEAQRRSLAARKGARTRKAMQAWRVNKAEREKFTGEGTTEPERATVALGGPQAVHRDGGK